MSSPLIMREATPQAPAFVGPQGRLKWPRKARRAFLTQATSLSGQQIRSSQDRLLQTIVELIFKIPPVWEFAKQKARSKIADRGKLINISQAEEVEAVRALVPSWEDQLSAVQDTSVEYPDYYTMPFHAYSDGNLSWEAAFQVPSAAKLVHAPVMDPASKAMDPDGDAKMRASYSNTLQGFLEKLDNKSPRRIVDLGCASGLSTLELRRHFPEAEIVGIDLSPYFLAVAAALQNHRQKVESKVERIEFKHGKAEATMLPSESVDLVSACLIFHEVPSQGIRAILQEAHRILRPGGTMAIMEMNPASERFKRILSNPMAYVPFKATEPWLVDYITFDLTSALQKIGFEGISCKPSTPGHFTLAARRI